MAFWQAEEQFFRAFELFHELDHGVVEDAVTLPSRGAFVLTRKPDGASFLHTIAAERGVVRPLRGALRIQGALGLSVDPAGRRAFVVTRARGGGVELHALGSRDDPLYRVNERRTTTP
jgi:hypothetical protein